MLGIALSVAAREIQVSVSDTPPIDIRVDTATILKWPPVNFSRLYSTKIYELTEQNGQHLQTPIGWCPEIAPELHFIENSNMTIQQIKQKPHIISSIEDL